MKHEKLFKFFGLWYGKSTDDDGYIYERARKHHNLTSPWDIFRSGWFTCKMLLQFIISALATAKILNYSDIPWGFLIIGILCISAVSVLITCIGECVSKAFDKEVDVIRKKEREEWEKRMKEEHDREMEIEYRLKDPFSLDSDVD